MISIANIFILPDQLTDVQVVNLGGANPFSACGNGGKTISRRKMLSKSSSNPEAHIFMLQE